MSYKVTLTEHDSTSMNNKRISGKGSISDL